MELEVVGAAPATLFHTDDPVEVVEKAQRFAEALMRIVNEKNLKKRIGNKDHIYVEAWTLLGSMVGVFAVIEWTREIDGGYEARAVAKTLSGQEVGAAEAICLRSESKWADRDAYALKSMAQTRAVSKCLRAPLGFIVTLAGMSATPAEEIPDEEQKPERRQDGPPRYPIPTSWPKVLAAARACDNPDESEAIYEAFLRAVSYHLYGEVSLKALKTDERKIVFQKAAGAVCWLHDTDAGREGPFAFYGVDQWTAAWASVLDGQRLEIPDYVPPEPPLPAEVEEEAERLAREASGD
jgi:hypothetical protein